MATIEQLRKHFGATSDEDAILQASRRYGISPTEIADEVGYKIGGQWGNRLGASIDRYQANLWGVGEALGSSYAGERRRANEAAADLQRGFAREQGAITSYKDVGGVGDAFNYVGGLAVDSLPYLGEAAVGGLIGRGLMLGTRTAASIGRELGMPATVAAAERSLARGATAGGVAASYSSAVGDVLSSQREENGQMDLGSAAALGVPYAALNAFGLEGAAARVKPFRIGTGMLDNMQGVRGAAARMGVTGVTTGFKEGLSETGQEFINQAGRNAVNPNAGYFGPEALDRYGESFVGGAALGGLMGGGLGGWRRSEGYRPPAPLADPDPGTQTDLLNTPPPPPPNAPAQLGWNGRFEEPLYVMPNGQAVSRAQFEQFDPVVQNYLVSQGLVNPEQNLYTAARAAGTRPTFSPETLDLQLGIGPMPDHAAREADLQAAFGEPAGVVARPQDWLERSLDAGQMLSIQTGDAGGTPGPITTGAQLAQAGNPAPAPQPPTPEQAAIKAAEEKHQALRDAAITALFGEEVQGKPPVPLQPRELQTHTMLAELRDSGAISPEQYTDMVGQLRVALQSGTDKSPNGDVKALNAIAKEVKTLKEQADAANATSPGGNGGAGSADLGRGTGSQRTPGQPGDVRPAQPGAAPQAVPGASAPQLGTGPGRNDAALTEAPATQPVIGTNAPDAVARVEQVVGRPLTPKEKKIAQALARFSPRNQAILRDLLGLDEEGHQSREPLSYEETAARYVNEAGPNKGKPMDRQGLQAALKKAGINEKALDALRGTMAAPAVSTEELGIASVDRADGAAAQATGFRVSDQATGGADDFELDARTVRDQKATDEALASASPDAVAAADAEIQARKSVTDAEFDAKRTAVAQTAPTATPEPQKNLRDYLARDLARNDLAEVDIEDAAEAWDAELLDGDPPFDTLDPRIQAQVVRAYRNEVLSARRQGELIDEDRKFKQSGADGVRSAEGAGRPGGAQPAAIGVSQNAGAAGPRVESRSGADPAPDATGTVDWGDQATQLSRNTTRDGTELNHTAETLEDSLLSFMNADSLGRRVVIVETASDLDAVDDLKAAKDTDAVAWTRDGRAYLIADRIPVGQERGVFLHEVGGHLGLQRILGEAEFDRLVSKIVSWSNRIDNSPETRLAKAAVQRVNDAGTKGAQRNNELVAYFLEEAVNAGFNPTAMKYDSPVAQWLRTLWAAFKVGLRRLGILNIDKLTAQDVVNLGYGAARLNVTGRYHGTAAKVRRFLTKYMGTGEGAQAYGWGQYFTELQEVGEEYKRSDAKRKSKPDRMSTDEFRDKPDVMALLRDFGQALKDAPLKKPFTEMRGGDFGVTELLGLRGYVKYSHRATRAFLRDVDFMRMRHGAQTMAQAVDMVLAGKMRNVKGNLYATELAVNDDELLDWVKLLDEQPRVLRELLANDPEMRQYAEDAEGAGYDNGTGGSLYHYLKQVASEGGLRDSVTAAMADKTATPEARRQYAAGFVSLEDYAGKALRDRVDGMSDAEVVSRWLDSKGVKGVKMPVNHTRGGSYKNGSNFVVFNEDNVITTMSNPQDRTTEEVQFSKARKISDITGEQTRLTDALPAKAQDAWVDVKDFMSRKMPYVMTTFQILEQFGDKLPKLRAMIQATDLMKQESTALQMEVDEIVKRWDKLPKAAGNALSEVALQATLLGAYPEKAWDHKDNAHVPRERKADYDALVRKYNQLKATSPEGLKLYHDALAAFDAQRDQLEAATKNMMEKYGKQMPEVKRVPGPYFPLVRRGEYLAIGESKDLVGLKKQLTAAQEANAAPETITELNKAIDKLEKNDQHFWVSSHESRSEMERALKDYERRGLVPRASMADQRLNGLPTRNLHATIAALTAEATKNLTKDGAKEVGNALAEILLRSLPEGHALERQASRKGVSGAMEDMKRAVAIAGRQNAHYIARLNHAKDVADALNEMGRDDGVKGNIDLMHVHRELELRHALNLQFHDTPWQDAIGQAAWTWFLGASPAFLAINMAQPWLVSAPVLAGQYGAGAATKALARGTADAVSVLIKARTDGGGFDLWRGIDPESVRSDFNSRNAKGELVGEERKALRELMKRGIIDEGLNPELAMYANSGGSGLLAKLSRAFSWPAQQIELVNRVATALAAFRLERAKGDYQKALDAAYAAVVNTHVDYGAENAPRIMREGGGIPLAKLLFQFRRYQQAMMYLLVSNARKLTNPGERKTAMATLSYLALTSGAVGGALGLPLMGSAMFIKDLFGDDDDEEGDSKTKLRNALYDLSGDKTFADVLAKGLPTLVGMDISERAGMSTVGQMFPRLDLSRSKTAEDKAGKIAVAVAGPAGGLAVQGLDAASYFGAGDWMRGTERLLPKMFADPVRAARESVTGQEDRKGEQLMSPEELSIWDTIRRTAGVSSMRESDRYQADQALKSVERGIGERRDTIHKEFRRAMRTGDYGDARAMIAEFNADHPGNPIKPKDEQAWRKEAARAGKDRDPQTGLKVTQRQQPYAEVQRFAQQ